MVQSKVYIIGSKPSRFKIEKRFIISDLLKRTQRKLLIEYSERSQCGKMSNYIETSKRNKEPQEEYIENSSALYGYFSEITYGLPPDTTNTLNQNSCSTMPLVRSSDIAIAESEFSLDNNHQNVTNIHNQISQLALHPHNEQSSLLDSNDIFLSDVATEVCSTMKWRSPNLSEVISFLNNPNSAIKANAAAYLQHLCYMDDPNKQRTRTLGGIPPLVKLLSSEIYEVHNYLMQNSYSTESHDLESASTQYLGNGLSETKKDSSVGLPTEVKT